MQNVGVKEIGGGKYSSVSALTRESLIAGIVYSIAGIVSSLAKIMGFISPLGIAFVSAVPFNYSLSASLGSAIGYILSGEFNITYKFSLACVIIGMLRYFLGKTLLSKYNMIFSPIFSVIGVVAAAILPNLYTRPMLYDIIIWVAMVMLGGSCSLFFIKTIDIMGSRSSDGAGNISFSIAYMIAVMGLCSVNIYGISLGNITAFLGIMISSFVGGVAVSSVIGIISGFAIGFSGNDFASYMSSCGIGGVLSGVFSSFGKLGSIISLISVCCFSGLLTGRIEEYILEVAVAALLFIIIPKSWLKMFISISKQDDSKDFQILAEEKLRRAAEGLTEVTDITNELAVKLDDIQNIDINRIYDKIALNICKRCPYCINCWQKNFDDTVDSISYALRETKEKHFISEDNFPPKFVYCIKKKEIADFITDEYGKYSIINNKKIKTERTRSIVNKQINSVANILNDISGSINSISFADEVKRASIEEMLIENSFEPLHVSCCANEDGKLKVIIYIPLYKEGTMTAQLICAELNLLLMKSFTYPIIEKNKNHCILTFCEETDFSCKYGAYQKSLYENACGDSYTVFTEENTKFNIVLSDGMGTGSQAAVDSKLTVSLIKKLVTSGISYKNIVNIVNSQLMVKSGNESTSTIDAVELDLYTGNMKLYKAGAAPTLIYRRGKIISIDVPSLPVGILDSASIATEELTLCENDIVILMSDGVIIDNTDWILNVIENNINASLETLSESIGKTAALRRNDGREDDITVICFKLYSEERERKNKKNIAKAV